LRKSRIKFAEVGDVVDKLVEKPEKFFDHLEELSIKIPSWSKLLFIVLMSEKKTMEVAFFEEAKEFFLLYTKKVLRYSPGSVNFICFSCENSDVWKLFTPPTLIGSNLKTRLRKKL